MKIKHYLHYLAIIVLLMAWGCTDDAPELQQDDQHHLADLSHPDIQRIRETGVSIEGIQEFEDYYLAEGDIIFYKDERHGLREAGVNPEQARSTYLVSPAYWNVRVYLNPANFSAINLNTAVNTSIAAFNNLNSGLKMTRVYSASQADIVISRNDGIGSNVCGRAGFPFSNGRPFNTVYISETTLLTFGLTSQGQLTELVAHELGHCVGLRHTNWAQRGESFAQTIPGTPTSDNASVMNGGSCGVSWNGFSFYDGVAMRALYSAAPADAANNLVPGETLTPGQFIRSNDNRFIVVQQTDGNLVLYQANIPLWSSGTYGRPVDRCVMQGDGNLVQYGGSTAYWNSGTYGFPNAYAVIQNDGNFVIYQGGAARWSTNTCCR